MENLVDNIDLVRKIAWKFTKKTGLDYDELFQEAALRYCLALEDWDEEKSKNCKFSSFAYRRMYFRLINFCKEQTKLANTFTQFSQLPSPVHPEAPEEREFDFWEEVEKWPQECIEIAAMVLDEPEKFLGETPNFSRNGASPKQRIKNELRERGWKHKHISKALKDMKTVVQTL